MRCLNKYYSLHFYTYCITQLSVVSKKLIFTVNLYICKENINTGRLAIIFIRDSAKHILLID